jgi:hypothetical protein
MIPNILPETLLAQIRPETNKYKLASLLRELAKCEHVPLDRYLLELVNDPRWLVRYAAIDALGHCPEPEVETCLLTRTKVTDDFDDLVYINASLGQVGSIKSIPYLSEMTRHKKEDVATSALAALTRIGSCDNLPLFIARLAYGRSVIKWYAMAAINKHGDKSAIEPVIARVKQILSRRRKIEQHHSELALGLEFLWKMRKQNHQIEGLLSWVNNKRKDFLFPDEKALVERFISQMPNSAS